MYKSVFRRSVCNAIFLTVHRQRTASTNNEARLTTTREDTRSIYSEIQGVCGYPGRLTCGTTVALLRHWFDGRLLRYMGAMLGTSATPEAEVHGLSRLARLGARA